VKGEIFTVGCDREAEHGVVWTQAQLLNEGIKPAIGSWVNWCDDAGCGGTIRVNRDISGCLVAEDERPE